MKLLQYVASKEGLGKMRVGETMKTKNKAGFSLIEIMVSALLLSVLALGGASALYHTGAVIQNQEQKRMAVDQAMERLELVKRTRYSIMKPENFSPQIYYYVDDGDDLLEDDEVSMNAGIENQKKFEMVTTITRFPMMPDATEYLQISVSVTYDLAGQQVVVDSIIVPNT